MDTSKQTTLINPTTCFAVACVAFSLFAISAVWNNQQKTSHPNIGNLLNLNKPDVRPKVVRRRGVDSLYVGRGDANATSSEEEKTTPDSVSVLSDLIVFASSLVQRLQTAHLPEQSRLTTTSLRAELSSIITSLRRVRLAFQKGHAPPSRGTSIYACFTVINDGLHESFSLIQSELSALSVNHDWVRAALQHLRDQRPALEFLLEISNADELPPTPPCDSNIELEWKAAPPTGITPMVDCKGWIEPPPEYEPPSQGTLIYLAAQKPDSKSAAIAPSEQLDDFISAGGSNDATYGLYNAVTDNDCKSLAGLLSKGASANEAYGDLQRTAIHQAAHLNHCSCLSLLLNNGSVVTNTEDASGDMPIHLAAWAGHVEALSVLVAHGADVDWLSGRDGYSPLWCAVSAHHIDAARLLLKHGTRVSLRSSSGGLLPLHQAAVTGQSAMCELLLERGAQIDALDDENNTALHYASVSGSSSTVKALLRNGAQVDLKQAQGLTPAHWAAHKGAKEILTVVLAYGAPINTTAEGGATPLHMAANRGHLPVTRLLLEKGASWNVLAEWDGVEGTPAQMAKAKGHSKTGNLIASWKRS